MGATRKHGHYNRPVIGTALTPVGRLANALAALGSVLAGKAMIACRLRRPPEGWRRTVGILLRAESTRFAVSAPGLRVPLEGSGADPATVQQHLANALREYLAGQPDAHYALDWHDLVTVRLRSPIADVVLLEFSPAGELTGLTPHLAGSPATGELEQRVDRVVVDAYNATRLLPETERPRALKRAVDAGIDAGAETGAARDIRAYAGRVRSACCLSFESVDLSDPVRRFSPPEFHRRRTLGFGFLSVVMRLGGEPRAVDVWMSAHHVGLDGVPLQELMSGLERAWGRSEAVLFPAADRDRPFMSPRPCSAPGERPVEEMLTFVDFSPVLALRQQLNARYGDAIGAPMTFGTLLAWLLNREPEFAGLRIASTVDVAASGGYERDVDVVPLRPADFATGGDPWDGLVPFAREFNRLISLSRTRTSPLRRGMQTAGLLPPRVHSRAVYDKPSALDETFGSLCITIIRDARVFVAPMTDLGLGDGFFAIGNTNLPSVDGGNVTAVSIKGEAGTLARHHAALQRVVSRSLALRPT